MSGNNFFFRLKYHMFYVLYPFVTYLVTVPRTYTIFKSSCGGERLSPLGTSDTNWPTVPAPDVMYEYGEFDAMRSGRGNRSTR
jgi:hypothetical protein